MNSVVLRMPPLLQLDNTLLLGASDATSSMSSLLPSLCQRPGQRNQHNKLLVVADNTNQHNSGDGGTEVREAEEVDNRSQIYIYDRSDRKVYLLDFMAEDVVLIPVYLRHRTFEENSNDKCNQPRSTTAYMNYYSATATRFNQLHKSYKVDKGGNDKVSVMSSRRPLYSRPCVEPAHPRRRHRVSDRQCSVKGSLLRLHYNDLYFEVQPSFMELRYSRPHDPASEEQKKQLMQDLNMPLMEDIKNKGQIVVRYKGDVLKFLFKVADANYSRVKVTNSVGVSCIDDNVYIKIISPITDRPVYPSMPGSTYNYIDPMIAIRRKNMYNKLHKIEPRWRDQTRRLRIHDYEKCRVKNPYDDLMDLKMGSNICFEGQGCLNKAKAGTLPCMVDDDDYENYVIGIQKQNLQNRMGSGDEDDDGYDNAEDGPGRKERGSKQNFENTFDKEIPDWDMVIYAK